MFVRVKNWYIGYMSVRVHRVYMLGEAEYMLCSREYVELGQLLCSDIHHRLHDSAFLMHIYFIARMLFGMYTDNCTEKTLHVWGKCGFFF